MKRSPPTASVDAPEAAALTDDKVEAAAVQAAEESVAPAYGITGLEWAQLITGIGIGVALLRYAAAFFIPLLFGMLAAYTLESFVTALARIRVPRPVGAAMVLAITFSLVGGAFYSLWDDAADVLNQLPEAARKIRVALHQNSGGAGRSAIANVQRAAVELDKAAAEASGTPQRRAAPPTEQESALLKSAREFIVTQTAATLELIAQLLIACMIAYFMLASGDAFRRKLARIAGPSLARRRVTIEILDEIDLQIQRYMLVLIATNILIGFATWGFFAAMGVERAALWGVVAAILHMVPYAGTAALAAATAVVGMVQFSDLGTTAILTGGTIAIAAVIGMGFNTWLQGRASRMNSVVLFAGILFFGWLWGGWGLLLGTPLLAVIKTVADRVAALTHVAEIMSD